MERQKNFESLLRDYIAGLISEAEYEAGVLFYEQGEFWARAAKAAEERQARIQHDEGRLQDIEDLRRHGLTNR